MTNQRWNDEDLKKFLNPNKEVKKRQQVNEKPITESITNSVIQVKETKGKVYISFIGARILSLNEILAILQYRKHIIFPYKKLWHSKVNDALFILQSKQKFSKCKITLFRQATKKIDNDSLPASFKYIIDALKNNIISEDDPETVLSIECYQAKGEHLIGIIIEQIEENELIQKTEKIKNSLLN